MTRGRVRRGRGKGAMTQIEDYREYIDRLRGEGYTVLPDIAGSDPDLIDPGGSAVETWRENYPYDERMGREEYEEEKYKLQVELLKFQYWTQDVRNRHIVLFEGSRRGWQGWHHQALRGAPEPAPPAHRRAHQAERDRAGPVVLPALHPALPHQR